MTAAVLYTPEVLALATSLARWPLESALPLSGEARSPACGSVVRVALTTIAGDIAAVGLQARACAIGQAAAAIFAQDAIGRCAADLAGERAAIEAWLKHGADLPDWPGLAAIAAARAYPARHGAILLPWTAALAALGEAAPAR